MMAIDYGKITKGMVLKIHVCDDCQHKQTGSMIRPPESGKQSLYCGVCEHYNIGSTRKVIVGDWYYLRVCDVEGIK